MLGSLLEYLGSRRSGDDTANDGTAGDTRTEEGPNSTSVWDLIPRWQYTGQHVETGGATKDEQTAAIEDVQSQADAIEAAESTDPDPEPDDTP